MRILRGNGAERAVAKLESRGTSFNQVEPAVRRIIREVRKNGDRRLIAYATLWDGLQKGQPLRVSSEEIAQAWHATPSDIRAALRNAATSIRRFCKWQMPHEWSRTVTGGELAQVVRPLSSVGCYVPGGRYPLPSTLLMTVIPAQIAGVPRICVMSPRPHTVTLAAAALLGVIEVYRCGGAQAIAALAYGTESVARVDKIVGPGNKFVTVAKKLVSFDCSIDMLAGPTEAVLYSDDGNPIFLASDMVAQAEHDPDALVIFVTTRLTLAEKVKDALSAAARGNPIAQKSIRSNGLLLVAASQQEALEWVNRIAPEHLTVDDDRAVSLIRNAGSVFVGEYSAQSAGDYAAGPNHVLPTSGAARFRAGLSVHDFVKLITVQRFEAGGLKNMAPTITTLAGAEGLLGHAESVRARCGRFGPASDTTAKQRVAHA